MTHIREERLKEFQKIYEWHYQKKINDSELHELTEKFINLIKYLLYSNSKDLWKK